MLKTYQNKTQRVPYITRNDLLTFCLMQLTIQDGGYKNRRRGGNSAMSILPWGGGGQSVLLFLRRVFCISGVQSVTCFSRFTVGSYKEQNQQTKNNEPYNPINFSSKLFAICYWNLRYFRTLTALLRHIHRQEPIIRSLHTNCTLKSTLSRIFLFLELRYVGVL